MDPISVLAAGGIRSRMESLDLLANNLANAATNGYKNDREFYSLFTSNFAGGGSNTATLPLVDSKWTDFSQGVLQKTSNSLDLALVGQGFFAVNGPSGPLYTRNGAFQLSAAGTLITSDGYPLTKQGGGTITLDPARAVDITPDGDVQQNGVSLGRLQVVNFPDSMGLAKQGNNYFRNPDVNIASTPAKDVEVRQGHLENSNVNTPAAAVQLVGVMRQFEMLQKAITLALDMNRKGIDEIARIPT